MTELTERDIQTNLISQFWSASALLMPNYTPCGWFECDVFRVTKSGYFYEYEIKRTVSDFKADAKKCASGWGLDDDRHWYKRPLRHKHELLAAHEGPKRFYYVVPEGLEAKIEVPDFAGLLIAHERASHSSEQKPAPDLNRCKIPDNEIILARQRAYFRYLHLYCRMKPPQESADG